MPKHIKGVLIGGPKDGEHVSAPDNDKARNQLELTFKDAWGKPAATYVKDFTEYPDGITRWNCVWIAGAKPIPTPERMSQASTGGEKARLTLNRATEKWELWFKGSKLAECPKDQIQSAEDAEAFRDAHISL